MSDEVKSPQSGDKIAQYTVLHKLGSGGMGDVYLCDDPQLGRQVAVKVLHAYDQSDMEIAKRFVLEGKALAKLTHPNIVSVFGLGEGDGFLYIAMEYVPGRSLFQLSRERRLSIREMISIFADVAAGLDHAHSHGIVHRDIKPANILVDTRGRAKIIDFGIAKVVGGNPMGSEGVKTKTGAVIGTLNYIAPELFRGIDPSPSSDIYALGLIFAEMLTGRTPFKGESQFATMEMIRDGRLDIPENLRLVLPPETWSALDRIIAREPEHRPPSAGDAAKLLEAVEFPNLPSYFNSQLVSVRIENVDELQDRLDGTDIDPAEWQFILSLAVRNHARTPSSGPEEESTRLIEQTGVYIPSEMLDAAIENYRMDLDSIITLRRSENLSALTPPPVVGHVMAATGHVVVEPVIQRKAAESVSSDRGISMKWMAGALVAVLLVGGAYFQFKQSAIKAEAQALAAKEAKPRRGGAEVGAPPVAAAAVDGAAKAPSSGSGFAMVIEPAVDAWPPIAYVEMSPGFQQTWKWKQRSTTGGDVAFVERRIFEGIEDGLQKFKVERLKRGPNGSGILTEAAGTEWYQPGFAVLPRKTLQSKIFGSIGGASVGDPSAIFPLRKGKEVQFELNFKTTEPVAWSPVIQLSSGFSTHYRTACSVRDKVKLQLASGLNELVKVDCYTKSDAGEISDVLYISPEKNMALRHDRRLNANVGGIVNEVSMSGELVENVSNPQSTATIRAPSGDQL